MFLRIVVTVIILINGVFTVHSQSPFFHYFQDTLKPGHRVSGTFDSIDVTISTVQTTLPTLHSPNRTLFQPRDWYNTSSLPQKSLRFSSIPHVGLYYSFGSNTSQQAGITYTQALSANQFAQMDYNRISSAGAIRNAAFENNRFQLNHLIRLRRYASQLRVAFDGTNKGLNGGFVGDTVEDPSQPIEFNAVNKPDASLRERRFEVDLWQFLSFTKDSLLKTGLYVRPRFRIQNRLFEESGDMATIYGVANIDPDRTRDHWERSEIGATAGYFFHTRTFAVNAGVFARYWDFDNLSRHSDTTETGLSADLSLQINNNIALRASGELTLTGATGENNLTAGLSYRNAVFSLSGSVMFQQKYPDNYQRFFYGNVLDYSWQNKQLTTTSGIQVNAASFWKYLPLKAAFDLVNVQHNPFFVGNQWRQDTLVSLSVMSFRVHADLKWRKLFFQPEIRLQQSTLNWIPDFQALARLGFDGFLFKAKKLRATIGVEAGYTGSYQLLGYVPVMDTYVLTDGSAQVSRFNEMPKLHVFTQYELGFFRWFIRVENIEQAFLKTVNMEAIGYPVVPLQLRIGMSWDLFN